MSDGSAPIVHAPPCTIMRCTVSADGEDWVKARGGVPMSASSAHPAPTSWTTASSTAPSLPKTWEADWITASDDVADNITAPLLRRSWQLPQRARSAVLHLSGLGTALCWVNGRPASDQRLAPGLSDYTVAARAVSWDVTAHVAGRTDVTIGVELGRGFFDLHTPEEWDWSIAPWRDRPRLTAQLHVQLEDGSTTILSTDGTWRCAGGGTRFDSLYEGETWDQTLEPDDWTVTEFDDTGWSPVRIRPAGLLAGTVHDRAAREIATTDLPLREAIAPPIMVHERLEPTWTRLADGRWVGDVGRVIAGWIRAVPLRSGRIGLSVRHGEQLAEDGSVIAENRFIPTGRFQTDHLLLDGRPWEAHHTYKGFRYIEVSGLDAADAQPTVRPGVDVDILACEAHAAVAVTGGTSSSDPTLDWLDGAFVRTVQTNLHWVLTDTPTYEKNGWTGDAQVALPAILARFDMSRFLVGWLDDMLDAQRADGALPVIVPSAGWGFAPGPCAPAPEWTTLYPVLVDAMAREYAMGWLWDLHGAAVEKYLAHELGVLDEDGLAVGILGDYLAPGRAGEPPEDVRLESSLALRHALDVVVRADEDTDGAVLGSGSRARFAAGRDALADAVNRVFLDEETGLYSGRALHGSLAGVSGTGAYRQAPQVLALDAGIVPDRLVPLVLEHLVGDLERRGDHHDLGCLGMARLCSVLVRNGHGALAVRVATNPTPPSWEVWRRAGHQTLLEMWIDPVRSRAHYFQGAGIRFIEEDLVGLTRIEDGWRRFRVAPRVVDVVERVEARRTTADGGEICAEWQVLAQPAVDAACPPYVVSSASGPHTAGAQAGSPNGARSRPQIVAPMPSEQRFGGAMAGPAGAGGAAEPAASAQADGLGYWRVEVVVPEGTVAEVVLPDGRTEELVGPTTGEWQRG
jgi:alpha-L-rhamnosidase